MDDKSIQIPGWKIIRVIGQGGFGKVYEVEKDDEFGGVAHSALKVISIPESKEALDDYRQDGYDDAALATLLRDRVEGLTAEFRLMSRLKGCSNIVSYEDHTVVRHRDDPGFDVLIRMELLTPLSKYLDQSEGARCSESTVKKLGIGMCSALERCARHNIIHRDIKPQNIFINEDGDFKLGDFGIAKTSDHLMRATKTGTYSYMAPEVYHGKPYHVQVDIYSLGMVLYWMLNERRTPFLPLPPAVPGPNTVEEALSRRMQGEMLPPPKHGSEELKRIVLKACAFDPNKRYRDATALKNDLERLVVREDSGNSVSEGAKPRRTVKSSGFTRADPTEFSVKRDLPNHGGCADKSEIAAGGSERPSGSERSDRLFGHSMTASEPSKTERSGGFGKLINRNTTSGSGKTGPERSGSFGKLVNRSITSAPEKPSAAVSADRPGTALKSGKASGKGEKARTAPTGDEKTVALSDAVQKNLHSKEPEPCERTEDEETVSAYRKDKPRR